MVSRGLDKATSSYNELVERISAYAANLARKLREQNTCTSSLYIFLHTSPFSKTVKPYSNSCVINLPEPSNSSFEILHFVREGFKKIYRMGYEIKKLGIMAMDIVPANSVQLNMFYKGLDREKQRKAMQVLDSINKKHYLNKVFIAAQGSPVDFKMSQELLSDRYTTRWDEILKVKMG